MGAEAQTVLPSCFLLMGKRINVRIDYGRREVSLGLVCPLRHERSFKLVPLDHVKHEVEIFVFDSFATLCTAHGDLITPA